MYNRVCSTIANIPSQSDIVREIESKVCEKKSSESQIYSRISLFRPKKVLSD